MRCLVGDPEASLPILNHHICHNFNNQQIVVEQNKRKEDCHSYATFLPGQKVSNCQICHRKYILPLVAAFIRFHCKRILPFHFRHFVKTLSPLPKCSRIFNHQWSCQFHFAQKHIVADFYSWVIWRWNRNLLLKKEDWPQFKSLQKERR